MKKRLFFVIEVCTVCMICMRVVFQSQKPSGTVASFNKLIMEHIMH